MGNRFVSPASQATTAVPIISQSTISELHIVITLSVRVWEYRWPVIALTARDTFYLPYRCYPPKALSLPASRLHGELLTLGFAVYPLGRAQGSNISEKTDMK